jgi:ribonuclease BN (tRNA processing enzyme)/DNA-binding NarL/FixJ family response regulator
VKRLLLADGSHELLLALQKTEEAKKYDISTATNAAECLDKLTKDQPDLLLVDLFLPGMHGIEILKKIRSSTRFDQMGVILSSSEAMSQNYYAALKAGANYFLTKPFPPSFFFSTVEKFFAGTLHPESFASGGSSLIEGEHCYLPKRYHPNEYIKFWGTRGSNPVSGPEYVRYGGNTACLEIRHGKDLVIIDAGTGIHPLGNSLLESDINTIHLVISHTHWDHLTGFPFFNPIYHRDKTIYIYAPVGYERTTHELFTDMLAYAFFPVRLDDIQAKIIFCDLRDSETITVGNIAISAHYAHHPGSTLCFKIHAGDKKVGYATDNEVLMGYHGAPNAITKDDPRLEPHQPLIAFFQDCDILIHEAQYTPIEYQTKVGWGHSSISNAAVLVKHTGVKDWIVTHHDPTHTDVDLYNKIHLHYDIMQECGIQCQVRMAFDGMTLSL